MRSALIALALFYVEVVSAGCPTTFVDDGGWHTSDPEWSADTIYVITTFSLSNDASGDVDFSALTAPETLQRWVNYPVGGDPYVTPIYDIPDASLTFKTSPAGNVYASGATITWQVAMDISGAPAGYQNTLSMRPEEGGSYGQFSYTLLSSSISCSSGEPFFASIAGAEAGVDEISLTVAAEAGSATITSYDAICEDTGGNETGASSTGTSITVADLENGEDYTCTVTASNSIGTSIASGPAEISTPSSGLPVWLMYVASPSSGCNNTNDTDGDRLLDCYETNTGTYISSTDTGTDPNNADTDSDGISDGDEVLGTLDGLNLPAMGTNPLKKTILIEYDWLSDDTQSWRDISAGVNTTAAHNHRPSSSVIADVEAVFAAAPVNNPDGSTGIQIIQDYGQGDAFTGGNEIADGDGNLAGYLGADFYDKKALNFASNRNGYFHYTILAHKYGGGATESSGYAEIQGDDLVVTSNWWLQYDFYVAPTIVHELGHNLGLRHGGYENRNGKPNYNSVMNYNHQFPGVDTDCTGCGADCSGGGAYLSGDGLIDYSSGTNSSLNENALTESFGICSNVATDWDRNGSIDGGTVSVNINPDYDSTLRTLTDFDDWTNIYYQGPLDADGAVIGRAIETVQCDNVPPNPF